MNHKLSTNKYTPIIGMEIHVELNTKTKMFCRCSADIFGAKPNTHTCPVCLGLPGALPYTNRQAIEDCIKIGLALNCKINLDSYFERKNYFYADLAKGFQTSQFLHPFGERGYLEIKVGDKIKKVGITRVHMEEDTGKNTHTTIDGKKVSLIDFNRSSIPLVEIVTEPDIHSGEEAKAFLTELQKIVRYVGVSDADMDKGNMRLEPNISLRSNTTNNPILPMSNDKQRGVSLIRQPAEKGDSSTEKLPPYKVEVKNINSFRFVDKAIQYETKRQAELLDKNETPKQETRGWNENKNETVSQRSKEEAHDYRYFPEPDIPPIHFSQDQISIIRDQIPELPIQKTERYTSDYELSYYDAEILTRDIDMALFFEQAVELGKESNITAKQIANAIINKKADLSKKPEDLVNQIKESSQVTEIDPKELELAIEKALSENEKAVSDYKSGKIQVIGYLIGQVKKQLQKADTNQIKTSIEQALK